MNFFDHREWGIFSIYLDEEGKMDTNKGFWFKIHWFYVMLLMFLHAFLYPFTIKFIVFKLCYKITLSYLFISSSFHSIPNSSDCRDLIVFHSLMNFFAIISGIFVIFLFV